MTVGPDEPLALILRGLDDGASLGLTLRLKGAKNVWPLRFFGKYEVMPTWH